VRQKIRADEHRVKDEKLKEARKKVDIKKKKRIESQISSALKN
jgi:hypothetical protein